MHSDIGVAKPIKNVEYVVSFHFGLLLNHHAVGPKDQPIAL
jgi:hypothetical protein